MIKILHLYYDLMNLYGDYGNLEVLKKHLNDQGLKVKIDKQNSIHNININKYDFIYIGSGTESAKDIAGKDLLSKRKDIKEFIKEKKIMFLTGNAMELVSNEYLGLLKMDVIQKDIRYIGNIIVENKKMGEVVGFINKSTIIENESNKNLFKVNYLADGLDKIEYEGYKYNNLIGTHLIGPVLVKNPCFMKCIVELVLKTCSKKEYKDIDYEYERLSHEVAINEIKKRIK